jgi:hypothetical protein
MLLDEPARQDDRAGQDAGGNLLVLADVPRTMPWLCRFSSSALLISGTRVSASRTRSLKYDMVASIYLRDSVRA